MLWPNQLTSNVVMSAFSARTKHTVNSAHMDTQALMVFADLKAVFKYLIALLTLVLIDVNSALKDMQ